MTINPELCTWWFGKPKYEKPSVPYNTALTTWSTYRIFTAVFTFVFMSQLVPESYAYSWSVFTGLNWHLTITYGCLPLAVWLKNIPFNAVSDALHILHIFHHIFVHFFFLLQLWELGDLLPQCSGLNACSLLGETKMKPF